MKLLLVATFLLSACSATWSCSCVPQVPTETAFEESAAIFSGRCVAARVTTEHDSERRRFAFEVTHVWKGDASRKKIFVTTGDGYGDCGLLFILGMSYIVYCRDNGEHLETSICMRRYIIGEAEGGDKAEVAILDALEKAHAK